MSELLPSLRRVLNTSKLTRYRLAKNTGISASILSRFSRGSRGLSVELAVKLADALGHEIVLRKKTGDR